MKAHHWLGVLFFLVSTAVYGINMSNPSGEYAKMLLFLTVAIQFLTVMMIRFKFDVRDFVLLGLTGLTFFMSYIKRNKFGNLTMSSLMAQYFSALAIMLVAVLIAQSGALQGTVAPQVGTPMMRGVGASARQGTPQMFINTNL